jgi:hypothetical protein
MAKKKTTPKKVAKKAPVKKKTAKKKVAKKAAKKTADAKGTKKKKKAPAKKKGTGGVTATKLAELRKRFLGGGKPVAAKSSTAKKKAAAKKKTVGKKRPLTAKTADSTASESAAEAVVKKAMPGMKIVHPRQSATVDAARATTVHGANLKDLKIKYTSDSHPHDAVVDSASPQVRSQVVFVEQGTPGEDATQGPKAVIVRDGKVRGFQG